MSNDSVVSQCGQGKRTADLISDAGVTASVAELSKLDGVNQLQGGEVEFYRANVTAGTTWSMSTNPWSPTNLNPLFTGKLMNQAGSVRGVSVQLSAACATDSEIIRVQLQKQTAAGVVSNLLTDAQRLISATAIQFMNSNFALGSYAFAKGDRIGVRINSHTHWDATTDVLASVAFSY